ncbi:MAG: hypothetical protein ACM3ND_08655 [Acidobacteriota bacterium]|jgi:hypothetical protein
MQIRQATEIRVGADLESAMMKVGPLKSETLFEDCRNSDHLNLPFDFVFQRIDSPLHSSFWDHQVSGKRSGSADRP